ncbi:MAG: hypothetical protein JXR97_09040 [Planctomycetes bacterium]|nr:hypothetical protein [Planctomycetota bacterium]
MIPFDMAACSLSLTVGEEPKFVVVTGTHPRHLAFADHVISNLPGLAAWIQVRDNRALAPQTLREKIRSFFTRQRRRILTDREADSLRPVYRTEGFFAAIAHCRHHTLAKKKSIARAEKKLLKHLPCCAPESDLISAGKGVECITVDGLDNPEALALLERIKPFLILDCSHADYSSTVFEKSEGAALRFSSGRVPDFSGADGIWQALYHRRIDGLGAGVHFVNQDGSVGLFLQRCCLALTGRETAGMIYLRSLMAGAELMVKATKSILKNPGRITAYEPLPGKASTPTFGAFDRHMARAVRRDLASGVLMHELEKLRAF